MILEIIGASVFARLYHFSPNQSKTYRLETTTISLAQYFIVQLTVLVWVSWLMRLGSQAFVPVVSW